MKGYMITLSNNLLEPKHLKNMGVSVWLYIWFIDKTTVIKDGNGKVLGGKPIKYEHVKDDLGISRQSYLRYLSTLEDKRYITILRTPYGLIVEVTKAKKYFGNKVSESGTSLYPNVVHHDADIGTSLSESGTSNKTIQLDNTKTIHKEINNKEKNSSNIAPKLGDKFRAVIESRQLDKA